MKKRLIIMLTIVCMLLPIFCVSAEADMVNVARFQLAIASSEMAEHGADLANDGINDNSLHTWWKSADGDSSSYWQVDLGLPYKLSKIELEARIDANAEERTNIRILASETESFKEPVELAVISEDYGEMFEADITKKVRYRFIRVEKTDAKALSIGEIRVFVKKGDILQGIDAVSLAGQIPATDEEGRYVLPSDVVGTKYEKAAGLLSALNIMRGYPDGDFLPNDAITRAEFTTVVMRLIGAKTDVSTRSFADVATDHWAYGQIEMAYKKGIVNGIEPGIFSPDTAVLTPQVIKMLVVALGYQEAAVLCGGYPFGYMEIANQIGLFDGVSIENGDNITRGEIALICVNALDADIMKPGIMSNMEIHTAIKNETVLTECLHMDKNKGIVTGVGNTSLTKVNSKKAPTYIEIDGVEFETEIPNAASYLGYHVEYYYEDDESSDVKKIVALVMTTKNETVTIDSSNLIKVENDMLYYNPEDEEKIGLEDDMDLVYNGVCLSVYDKKTDLVPKSGSVILIDNDGNGEVDVYIVRKIDNYVVDSVNTLKKQVYAKNRQGALTLDSDESDITIIDKSTGENVELSAINEWNILSVMESRNETGKKCYYVIVSTELIRGTYKGKGRDYAVIDDKEFKTAECFDKNSVELGSKGMFYLDAENKIAAFNGDNEASVKYGYLRTLDAQNIDMADRLALRVFTDKGIFETLKCAEEVIIDGNPYKDPEIAEDYIKRVGAENGAQAIRYSVNAKGEVKNIYTVTGSLSLDYDAQAENPAPMTSGRGYYYTIAGTFDALFSIDTDTVIIELPSTSLSSEKDYKLLSAAGVRAGRYYYVEAYDTGEERVAKLLLFTSGASGGASDSSTFFLVEDILRTINEDGDEVYEVTGLYNGEKKTYITDAECSVDVEDFTPGTVMTLAFRGEAITDYDIKFFRGTKPEDASNASVSEDTPQYGANIQGMMGTLWLGYGTVETKKDGIIRVSFENVDKVNPGSSSDFTNYKERIINLANVRIYYFDSEKDKVHLASASYVLDKKTVGSSDASKVLVRADSGNFAEMIILD